MTMPSFRKTSIPRDQVPKEIWEWLVSKIGSIANGQPQVIDLLIPSDTFTELQTKLRHGTKEDSRPQKGWWAPGKYFNHCRICKWPFIGDKRAGHCADCEYDPKYDQRRC